VLGYLSPCQVGEIAGRKAEVVRKDGFELGLEIGWDGAAGGEYSDNSDGEKGDLSA
jgi:hypothetical protein